MPIRLEPVVSFAYLYPPGVQIVEHVTPYEAIATILWDSPRRATVRGLHGRMTRAHRRDLARDRRAWRHFAAGVLAGIAALMAVFVVSALWR